MCFSCLLLFHVFCFLREMFYYSFFRSWGVFSTTRFFVFCDRCQYLCFVFFVAVDSYYLQCFLLFFYRGRFYYVRYFFTWPCLQQTVFVIILFVAVLLLAFLIAFFLAVFATCLIFYMAVFTSYIFPIVIF